MRKEPGLNEPGLKEDAKNLTLIGGAAGVAALLTAGLLFASFDEPNYVEIRVIEAPAVPAAAPTLAYEVVTPLSGSNRLYGVVHTTRGEEITGFIRWDRNEGSWTDLLDARKPNDRGGETLSGIRFGHVDQIEVLNRDAALFTLKSGNQVRLNGNSTDLGSGLRALLVDTEDGGQVELTWSDLEVVDFLPPPSAHPPKEGRLFGTLLTRRGMEFTGFIAWDVDEIYSSDVLDGDLDGEDLEIPFGAIQSIERFSSRSALVVLHNGEEMVLDNGRDVNSSNRGITVSDVNLGQVKLGWGEFDRVIFHGTDSEAQFVNFDGGHRIAGTVTTDDGEEFTGLIRWDDDEAYSWEMLDGEIGNVEFDIEFTNVASIEKDGSGARVQLRDGRVLQLSDTNDVDSGNRGIVIENGSDEIKVRWSDFRELNISR
jgi:hypothetical protein